MCWNKEQIKDIIYMYLNLNRNIINRDRLSLISIPLVSYLLNNSGKNELEFKTFDSLT